MATTLNPGPLRVGIDVGGTNTDAVLMRGREVLHGCKTGTTDDVTTGVLVALRQVMAGGGVAAADIGAVMIGTTQFTNAIVERRRLAPVGLLRLALPATRGVAPTAGWPQDMRAALTLHSRLLAGGHEFDGREIAALDVDGVHQAAREFAAAGVQDVAIAGVFSFLDDSHERAAETIVRQCMPQARITLASRIGRVGLLERENAAILNASLGPLGLQVVSAFEQALADSGIRAPFYMTQNDGTLLSAADAARLPILTVASGPTNSMRGAAFLSGLRDAIVVDIGGTTTDVGMLQAGFPRQAGVAVEVGGVRTNFRMPDVLSVGLGGGSLVSAEGDYVGPQSVGWRIASEALVFGGSTLTASDIAVAAGHAVIGDARRVAALDPALVRRARDRIRALVAAAVERVRTTPEPLPVLVVGGGSILLEGPQDGALAGVDLRVPPHHNVANAVGAAMAQVSGETDRVVQLAGTTREAAVAAVRAEAERLAIAAGADPASLEMIDTEDVPLSYLPGQATRIRVRVVGNLAAHGGTA
jgi:N-methylhydantoinase A/oxoprolinase/acetone carboxylase beta subunit